MFFRRALVLGVVLSILAWSQTAAAGDQVSGHYQGLGGNEITVELTVGNPAPASLILIQSLPKGIKVTASRPELKMYSPAKGEAKWLLSKVNSGTMTVTMTLDRAVGKGEINGELRYRDAAGAMVTAAVSK